MPKQTQYEAAVKALQAATKALDAAAVAIEATENRVLLVQFRFARERVGDVVTTLSRKRAAEKKAAERANKLV